MKKVLKFLKPSGFLYFSLGVLSGFQIEIMPGFYLSHLVILFLILFKVKFERTTFGIYLVFIFLCTFSLFYNFSLYKNEDFKIFNYFNSIFLYSTVIVKVDLKIFDNLFKGYFIIFILQFFFVLMTFNVSLLNNGIFVFFSNNRDWASEFHYFGNSFAILGLIIMFIYYKLYNGNLFLFFLITSLLILTTSRISLFGPIFSIYFFFERYPKYKYYFVFLLSFLMIYLLTKINSNSIDGIEIFLNRLSYTSDRSNLTEIFLNLFLKHPFVGNGPIYIEKYTLWEPHLHNIWYDIIANYGIFAFLLFLFLFLKSIKNNYQLNKNLVFLIFLFFSSISQISLKEPFIGLLIFSYLNLETNDINQLT